MSRLSPFLFLFCLVLTIAIGSSTAHSQSEVPDLEARQALPFMESTPPETKLESQGAGPVIPWSRIAYQAFRNNNWEIIVAGDDNIDQHRPAPHPAADMNPRLDRGSNRIAFVSSRDGDLNIYVVNVDGSRLRRLTPSNRDDARPSWSPDGTRIAFHSYDRGQAEVYVINADGTGLTRLTDHSGYDGSPAWSPDGKRIAFCREIGEHVYLHELELATMAVRQLTSQQDSCSPAYSPDGKYILYSADSNSDTWYELWIMDADGTDSRLLEGYTRDRDYVAAGFSPDGRWYAYSLLSYVWYGGSLYLISAESLGRMVDGSHSINITGGTREAFPDWQTTDAVAPATVMNPLPAFSRASGFLVSWQGQELGGSGLAGYELHRKRLDAPGSWEPATSFSTATRVALTGGGGRTVGFRVAGVDRAFNHEPIVESPESLTTLYTSALYLSLSDNRGAPLPGLTPQVNPAAVYSEATGDDGRATLLLRSNQSSLALVRTGYGAPPPITRTLPVDCRLPAYLPPAGSRIRNGHFEDTAAPLAEWTTAGSLPVRIVTSGAHSGGRSVSLGVPCDLDACISAREETIQTKWPDALDIDVDDQGRVHMVFGAEVSGAGGTYYYSIREANGAWSEPQAIFAPDGQSVQTAVSVSVDEWGTVHAAFARYGSNTGIFYASKAAGKPWSALAQVKSGGSGIRRIQFTPDGRPLIILGDAVYERSPAGSWRLLLSLAGKPSVQAVVDPNGFLHTVWATEPLPENDNVQEVIHDTFLSDGTLLSSEKVRADDVVQAEILSLQADTNGALHLIVRSTSPYLEGHHAYYLTKPAGQAWSAPAKLPPEVVDFTALQIDSRGTAHILYRGGGPVLALRRDPQGIWSKPVAIASRDYSNAAAFKIGPDDRLHAMLAPEEAFPQVGDQHYYTSAPATADASGTVSQVITIPPDIPNPTLAYMKRVLGDEPGDAAGAFVRLAADGLTQDFPITGDAEWSLGWVDATPWKGKTVTVTFGVNQTADAPHLQLLLDAVSLGPAYADTMTTLAGPLAALPGEEIAYVLTAGNRGGVGSGPVTVNLTVPAGLTLVEALPEPIINGQNLRWDIASLPAGATETILIRLKVAGAGLGMKVMLKAVLQTDPEEPEAANNATSASLFIGNQALAPIVIRP